MTPKQQRFVEEYLLDLNATQAAIRAGYSAKTAAEQGYDNLRKPQVAEAIQAAQEARSKRTEITAYARGESHLCLVVHGAPSCNLQKKQR